MKLKFILATILLFFTSQVFAGQWVYRAESPSAWGVGYSYNASKAKDLALYECAIRTPTWQTCYIVDYFWTD